MFVLNQLSEMHGAGSVKVCMHVVRFFILTFSVRFQFPFPLIKIDFNFGTHRQKVSYFFSVCTKFE